MASAGSTDGPSSSPSSAAKSYSTDPALYIYTSLTAGSSHIVTATSRLETILRARGVPFKAIDIATDEKARMLWGRRAGKDESGRMRKLPGLVQMGMVVGDLVEIEDWNEYGELKQHVTIYYDEFTQPPIGKAPKPPMAAAKPVNALAASAAAAAAATKIPAAPAPPPIPPVAPEAKPATTVAKGEQSGSPAKAAAVTTLPIRSVAEEAAKKAKAMHLQSLRDKVHGKKTEDKAEESAEQAETKAEKAEDKAPAATEETKEVTTPPRKTAAASSTVPPGGLQSPTSGAWKESASSADRLRETMQSPTSTTWKPAPMMVADGEVDEPPTSHRGSQILPASAEQIAAIEDAERIDEEPEKEAEAEEEEEEEEEAEEEEDEEDEDEEDEDEEQQVVPAKKPAESKPVEAKKETGDKSEVKGG